MGDFSSFHGRDSYPQGLSSEYIRRRRWTFQPALSGFNGFMPADGSAPFPWWENPNIPGRRQSHRYLREHAVFPTSLEHPFPHSRPSSEPSANHPPCDRQYRNPWLYIRPRVYNNIKQWASYRSRGHNESLYADHEANWRIRNVPFRPTPSSFDPVGVPPDHLSGQAAAVGGEKFPAGRRIPIASAHFPQASPRNSTYPNLNPSVETWPYDIHMRPDGIFTSQCYPDATVINHFEQYTSTGPDEEPLRNRSPIQGYRSTIDDDKFGALPEAWNQPNASQHPQEARNVDSWENIGRDSQPSCSPPEPWMPFPTTCSEQQPEQPDYFSYMSNPQSIPMPRSPTFNGRTRSSTSRWSRHRRRLPQESLRRITIQLRCLHNVDRKLKRERDHLRFERAVLRQEKEALRAEKSELRAERRRLQKAREYIHHHHRRYTCASSPGSFYTCSSDEESVDNGSGRTPPRTPSASDDGGCYYGTESDDDGGFEAEINDTKPSVPGTAEASAALERYNCAWAAHVAEPTSSTFAWPTPSLLPHPLTVAPHPLPRRLRSVNGNVNTDDLITYNTLTFFASAFNLRPAYTRTKNSQNGRWSWALGIEGLRGVDGELLGKMKAQVKKDVLRWHEDKRGKRGGDAEETCARAVYAGVFAFKEAIDEELERRKIDEKGDHPQRQGQRMW